MQLSLSAFLTAALLVDSASASGVKGAQKGSEARRPGVAAAARSKQGKKSSKRAGAAPIAGSWVYSITNLPNNEIIVYSRDEETGELTLAGRTLTGGSGGGFLGGGFLDATDPVIVANECVLNVNAGSNTVTSFRILPDGGLELADTAPSGGELPVSVAWRGSTVLVLNAKGLHGSIQGMSIDFPSCELTRVGGPIQLNQTVVPEPPFRAGVFNPSQIGFTPDDRVLALIKMQDGGGKGSLNLYDVDLDLGAVDPDSLEQIFIAGEGAADYAFEFTPDGQLLVVDAQGGALPAADGPPPADGEVRVGSAEGQVGPPTGNGQVRLFNQDYEQIDVVETGEFGSCWMAYNPETGNIYTANTPVGTISIANLEGDSLSLVNAVGAEQPVNVDMLLSPDYNYLYVTSCNFVVGPPTIYVYDVSPGANMALVQTVPNPENVNCQLGLAEYVGSDASVTASA